MDANTGTQNNEPAGKEPVDYRALYEAEKAAHEQTRQQSRKWEDRAKANKDGASKASTLEEQVAALNAQMAAITTERDELAAKSKRAEIVARVANATGVDAEIVGAFAANDEEGLTKAASLVKGRSNSYPQTRDMGSTGTTGHTDDDGLKAAVAGLFRSK